MGEKDGGQAFPLGNMHGVTCWGMTLRDWFAGQALVELIKMWGEIAINSNAEGIAHRAYQMADAMLAERGK